MDSMGFFDLDGRIDIVDYQTAGGTLRLGWRGRDVATLARLEGDDELTLALRHENGFMEFKDQRDEFHLAVGKSYEVVVAGSAVLKLVAAGRGWNVSMAPADLAQ